MPAADRSLQWDGCYNVRDLGGVDVVGGRGRTRKRSMVRSDGVAKSRDQVGWPYQGLSTAGWSALESYGIRTIINLHGHVADYPADICRRFTLIHTPLDGRSDGRFWKYCVDRGIEVSPLYYKAYLKWNPLRCAAVMSAIANARPGGVLIHCRLGRDRTGLISMLLLALVGADVEAIAADYEASTPCLEGLFKNLGESDGHAEKLAVCLSRSGMSVRDVFATLLSSVDIASYLRSAGVTAEEVASVRRRLAGCGNVVNAT